MMRGLVGIALVLASAALVLAVVHESRDVHSYADAWAGSVHKLRPLISQNDVRALLGDPQTVFRDNARAQCWEYTTRMRVRMCFGPKRRLAWWATNVPPEHPPA
jgi:hypothetical protein